MMSPRGIAGNAEEDSSSCPSSSLASCVRFQTVLPVDIKTMRHFMLLGTEIQWEGKEGGGDPEVWYPAHILESPRGGGGGGGQCADDGCSDNDDNVGICAGF